MKSILIVAVLLAVVGAFGTGCATYTFKCAKSVSWALTTDTNPATLTGMCDGMKTVVLEGPGPATVQHICDTGKLHWFTGNKLTCIPDPCAPGITIFGADGGLTCGNL
jgi:hypothetical protein